MKKQAACLMAGLLLLLGSAADEARAGGDPYGGYGRGDAAVSSRSVEVNTPWQARQRATESRSDATGHAVHSPARERAVQRVYQREGRARVHRSVPRAQVSREVPRASRSHPAVDRRTASNLRRSVAERRHRQLETARAEARRDLFDSGRNRSRATVLSSRERTHRALYDYGSRRHWDRSSRYYDDHHSQSRLTRRSTRTSVHLGLGLRKHSGPTVIYRHYDPWVTRDWHRPRLRTTHRPFTVHRPSRHRSSIDYCPPVHPRHLHRGTRWGSRSTLMLKLNF